MTRDAKRLGWGLVALMAITGNAFAAAAVSESGAISSAKQLDEHSRVRTSNPALAALIRDAVEGSATLRRLMGAIDASDGLVYIEAGRCGRGARACLVHRVTVAGPTRILYILIDGVRPDRDLMGAVGHELQHAIEVLSNPTIRTDLAIIRLYLHRGMRVNGVLETQEAMDVGAAVRDELGRVPSK